MKILIICNNFSYLSGSPMYVYELAREFREMGNDVTILSKYIGGIITQKAREKGIKVTNYLEQYDFDIVHMNQKWSEIILNKIKCPIVYTIHSEFPVEDPIRDTRILEYIAIRPTIAEKWGIESNIIYNPIDRKRFKKVPLPDKEQILFVGTIDYLRQQAATDVKRKYANTKFIGQKFAGYADKWSNWEDSKWNIENDLEKASMTAGIMLGRTTLEGFCMGRPGIIYDVGADGEILSITKHEVPSDMELEKYDSRNVANMTMEVYKKAINKYAKL